MLFRPSVQETCRTLKEAVRTADDVSAALMRSVLDVAAPRCATPDRAARVGRIGALIDAQAWTDAALALAALDRAHAVRHVAFDDGKWWCRIGSQWAFPEWLDDTIWCGHPVLALAIVGAVLDALSQDVPAERRETWRTSQRAEHRAEHGDDIASFGCDNYA
jgi:hypothetical protein